MAKARDVAGVGHRSRQRHVPGGGDHALEPEPRVESGAHQREGVVDAGVDDEDDAPRAAAHPQTTTSTGRVDDAAR